MATIRLLTSNERDWNRVPLVIDGLTGVDLDLRLSAAQITLGPRQARAYGRRRQPAGRQASVVTIGESQAFGGVLKGSMALAGSDVGAEFKSQLQFTECRSRKMPGRHIQVRRIDGRGGTSRCDRCHRHERAGDDPDAERDGEKSERPGRLSLLGWNVEQLLTPPGAPAAVRKGDFRNGRTPFEKLTADFKITEGIATVESVMLEGSKVRLGLAGSASIPARDFDLHGVASLAAPGQHGTRRPFELPFVVAGPVG